MQPRRFPAMGLARRPSTDAAERDQNGIRQKRFERGGNYSL